MSMDRQSITACLANAAICAAPCVHSHISLTLGTMHTCTSAYISKHSRDTFIVLSCGAQVHTHGNLSISSTPLYSSLTMSPHPSSSTLSDKEHSLQIPCSFAVEHVFRTAASKLHMPSFYWNQSTTTSHKHHVVNRHRI